MTSEELYLDHDYVNLYGNHIHSTAIVHKNVTLGKGNIIGPYTVIGSNGEIRGKGQNDFHGSVSIGNNNIISEHVTIQRPFEERTTYIGNDNIIMAHAHIGHDVIVGNGCEICTGAIIGGHTIIKDGVKLKLGATVRNRLTIGSNATIGLGSAVVKNVKPDTTVYGNPAR